MKRSLIGLMVLAIALVGSLPSAADTSLQSSPQICDDVTTSTHLFAAELKDGRVGYGLKPNAPTIPGPTLTMYEGDCLAVTLTNDASRPVGIHAHGVGYTVASDGTPIQGGCVSPGRSKTFVFEAHAPRPRESGTIEPGTAGYWHYHDHCMGGPHGTAGINAGLFGALIVRRQGDPLPDRDPFVVVMGPAMTLNLKKAPNTPIFEANQGEVVEFVVIGHGDLFHTFHLHAHRWAMNRTGIPDGVEDQFPIIDNRTIGPADSFGFQIVAGERVGPGAWMYHCHVQNHSDRGMVGIFLVRTPDGQVTPEGAAALKRWRRLESHHD